MRDDDLHHTMFSQPEDWPVDLRIAAVVALWIAVIVAAAFFFVRLVGI